MTGFVSFVSSGPGDPELLTLKAVNRLRAADVVLYDDLSSGPILDHARTGADSGRGRQTRGAAVGQAGARQPAAGRLCPDRGASVVRLKSGDAGMFGRLEEEIERAAPRASAMRSSPASPRPARPAAAAGIPLTRRLTARRVQFITGADVTGELPEDLNWAALADPQATTVVYMGKRTFPALAAKLIAQGLSPDTPALLAESVGQADQRLIRTTVKKLAEQLTQENVTATAVILYGALAADDP